VISGLAVDLGTMMHRINREALILQDLLSASGPTAHSRIRSAGEHTG
jgi:hypothetical protein